MASPLKAQEILDREFLEIRAKLLQLAANFDRIERGIGEVDLQKTKLLHEALEVLSDFDAGPQRAEKIQKIFSREYDPAWQVNFDITAGNIQRVPDR